jgi:hypothetical protein
MAKLAQIGDTAPCRGHTEWFTDFWSWDQIQNNGVIVPFPTHSRTSRFDVVWESYDWNSDNVSAESEGDVAAELGTNCNLGKTMASVCPAWRCPHHPPFSNWSHPRLHLGDVLISACCSLCGGRWSWERRTLMSACVGLPSFARCWRRQWTRWCSTNARVCCTRVNTDLTGLRLLVRRTLGLFSTDAFVDRCFDRWNFERTGHVATRGATDACDRVYCPWPGHNG